MPSGAPSVAIAGSTPSRSQRATAAAIAQRSTAGGSSFTVRPSFIRTAERLTPRSTVQAALFAATDTGVNTPRFSLESSGQMVGVGWAPWEPSSSAGGSGAAPVVTAGSGGGSAASWRFGPGGGSGTGAVARSFAGASAGSSVVPVGATSGAGLAALPAGGGVGRGEGGGAGDASGISGAASFPAGVSSGSRAACW